MPILAPYKMASTEVKKEPTVRRRSASLKVGGRQHRRHRRALLRREPRADPATSPSSSRKPGATGLRGGAFKPRTSPYSFQGLKEKGLELLAEAREQTGLAIVTEVMAPEHVAAGRRATPTCCRSAPATCRTIRCSRRSARAGKPVLLKRGPAATMDEFLLAAEYILKTGNTSVMLCERGIRTFEDHTRFTLPLATRPLPAPDDAPAGRRRSQPRHRQGEPGGADGASPPIAAGADGLIVEVHPDPEKALSDGFQALTPAAFRQMMAECRKVATALGKQM